MRRSSLIFEIWSLEKFPNFFEVNFGFEPFTQGFPETLTHFLGAFFNSFMSDNYYGVTGVKKLCGTCAKIEFDIRNLVTRKVPQFF